MIISRQQIDIWIECAYKFGKYVVNDTFKDMSNPKPSIKKVKDFLLEIASYEMKENIKYTLSEYRTKFTNKYFSSNSRISEIDAIAEITKLNHFFQPFANNIFFGYNIPVDIAITGSNIVYREVIDFGLIDESKNLTFIEFVNMKDKIYIKDKLKHWAHYYTPYSFLASSFNKDIKVIFIDPDVHDMIEFKFNKGRFDDDYIQLCSLITPIKSSYLYRNLNSCMSCSELSNCFLKERK